MQEVRKEHQNGRSETLPRTVHRTVAALVVAGADNEEVGLWRRGRSDAGERAWSPMSEGSWSTAGRTGPLAGW